MRPIREALGLADPPQPSLLQVADALILYDSPLLDQRFQEAIAMHPDRGVRAALAGLPPRVAEGSRLTRRAAVEWERVAGGTVLEERFRVRAERHLLDAFLDSAESQIRLKTFMVREAPTQEIRRLLEAAIEIHRELTSVLRLAASGLAGTEPGHGSGYLGAPDETGALRSRVEDAVRRMSLSGKRPRVLVVSANAQRRLRDEGLFRDGTGEVLGVPVQVDFGWPGSDFALLSYDAVPLDELLETAA